MSTHLHQVTHRHPTFSYMLYAHTFKRNQLQHRRCQHGTEPISESHSSRTQVEWIWHVHGSETAGLWEGMRNTSWHDRPAPSVPRRFTPRLDRSAWDILRITLLFQKVNGGQGGIRTLDTLPYTHFPGVLLQPLGHLTALCN